MNSVTTSMNLSARVAMLILAVMTATCSGVRPPVQSPRRASSPNVDREAVNRSCRELFASHAGEAAFKLLYRPSTGQWIANPVWTLGASRDLPSDSSVSVDASDDDERIEEADQGAHPIEGQRILVCVDSDDWRDSFLVTTSVAEQTQSTPLAQRSGDVGPTTSQAPARELLSGSTTTTVNEETTVTSRWLERRAPDGGRPSLRDFEDFFSRERTRLLATANALQGMLQAEGDYSSPTALEQLSFIVRELQSTDPPSAPPPQRRTRAAEAGVSYITDQYGLLQIPDAGQTARPAPTIDSALGILQVNESRLGVIYRQRFMQSLLDATHALENQRVQAVAHLLDAFNAPLSHAALLRLRVAQRRLLEVDRRDVVDAGASPPRQSFDPLVSLPVALPDARIGSSGDPTAFVSHLNERLPAWIRLTEGRLQIFMPALPTLDGAGTTGTPVNLTSQFRDRLQSVAESMATSIARTWKVVEFMEDVIGSLDAPRRVVDLGSYSGDRLVSITVQRTSRRLHLSGGQMNIVNTSRSATRIEEVHGPVWFRAEPGVAVSTRRNPAFTLGHNAHGDSVVQQGFAFDTQVQAALFFHFTPCALDLRVAPMWRTCGGSGLRRWSPRNLLTNIGFTVGLTPTPAVFQNLWLGLNFQYIPFVTFGGGVQISAFRSLPYDLAVGDAFTGAQADLDNRVVRDVGISPFFFLSINGQEVFARSRGFNF